MCDSRLEREIKAMSGCHVAYDEMMSPRLVAWED
jgi:hypothetical protein